MIILIDNRCIYNKFLNKIIIYLGYMCTIVACICLCLTSDRTKRKLEICGGNLEGI